MAESPNVGAGGRRPLLQPAPDMSMWRPRVGHPSAAAWDGSPEKVPRPSLEAKFQPAGLGDHAQLRMAVTFWLHMEKDLPENRYKIKSTLATCYGASLISSNHAKSSRLPPTTGLNLPSVQPVPSRARTGSRLSAHQHPGQGTTAPQAACPKSTIHNCCLLTYSLNNPCTPAIC
jgi:hypothetical protein